MGHAHSRRNRPATLLMGLAACLLTWATLFPMNVAFADDVAPHIDAVDPVGLLDTVWVQCPGAVCELATGQSTDYRTLVFTKDNRFYGLAGCNRYQGSYQLDGEQIRFAALVTTRMHCGEETMAREKAFLDGLQNSESYDLQPDQLSLYRAQGVLQATFVAEVEIRRTSPLPPLFLPLVNR